jgi:hypothetical protein
VLNVGSQAQRVLARSGDDLRIDWGYFHLATPEKEHALLANSSDAIDSFLRSGTLPASDTLDMPEKAADGAHLAVLLPADVTASSSAEMHVLLAYTEGYAIEYMQRRLREYWQRNGQTTEQMLEAAETEARGSIPSFEPLLNMREGKIMRIWQFSLIVKPSPPMPWWPI